MTHTLTNWVEEQLKTVVVFYMGDNRFSEE
jgi:hypothetical protein